MIELVKTDCVTALLTQRYVKLDMCVVREGAQGYKDRVDEVLAGSGCSNRLVVSFSTLVGHHSTLQGMQGGFVYAAIYLSLVL
jgi:hypothetical protein